MKTINYVPSVCKGDSPEWEGVITLRAPTFDEKYEYLEKLADLDVTPDGVVMSNALERVKSIRKLVAMSAKHYLSIGLKRKSDGFEVKTFEDMQYEDELHGVMAEVGSLLVSGFKAGNA